MDFARNALARVLTDQSLTPFLDKGITPDMMPDPQSGAVLKYVLDFYAKHQAVPSPLTVEQQFPTYSLGYAPDPASSYVEHIVNAHVRNALADEFLAKGRTLMSAPDPLTVASDMQRMLGRLAALGEGNRVRSFAEGSDSRLARYLFRKNNVGLIGIPTPWGSLDDMTQGWQPEMYFGVAARPKTGKTFFMLRIALAAWFAGYDVLFANFELKDDMMEDRTAAIGAKLPYEKFRSGMLNDAEQLKFERWEQQIKTNPPAKWHWVHQARTISALQAKVDELKPALVLIDGAYLMEDETGGRTEREQQKNLSRGFKRLAQKSKVPVGISIQLNRTGDVKHQKQTQLTASSVYGSDAFAQDVDLLLGLVQSDDQRQQRELQVEPLAVREAKATSFVVGWDFDTMESPDKGAAAVLNIADPDPGAVLTFKA